MARYDLHAVSERTNGRCHLCHLPAPVELYGPPGSYGAETVSVDHLEPQAFGGSHELANLMIAHTTCNSSRGVRPVEDVRMRLAGHAAAPRSSTEVLLVAAGASVMVGGIVGATFTKADRQGHRRFNRNAAALAAIGTFLVVAAVA